MKDKSPSATAQIVALNVAFIAARPGYGRLVDAETRDLVTGLLGFSPRARFWLRMCRRSWFHLAFGVFEACVVPGMALHQVLRKKWLEEEVTRRLEGGTRQVVILGGGLDTLAARMARKYPEVRFVEADHPATQEVKRKALARAGYLAPNLTLAAMDFNRVPLQDALLALPEFRIDVATMFICEGVLMYLDPPAVDRLFSSLASLPCPTVGFAFTYMESGADGRVAFAGSSPLVSAWLKWRKEAFTWGLRRKDLEAFLAARGFALAQAADDAVLRSRYLPGDAGARIAAGEKLAVATVSKS